MQTGTEYRREMPDWLLFVIFTAMAASSALFGSLAPQLSGVLRLSIY